MEASGEEESSSSSSSLSDGNGINSNDPRAAAYFHSRLTDRQTTMELNKPDMGDLLRNYYKFYDKDMNRHDTISTDPKQQQQQQQQQPRQHQEEETQEQQSQGQQQQQQLKQAFRNLNQRKRERRTRTTATISNKNKTFPNTSSNPNKRLTKTTLQQKQEEAAAPPLLTRKKQHQHQHQQHMSPATHSGQSQTTTATNITSRLRLREKMQTQMQIYNGLPPCRVLVQNSCPCHYEVMESVMEIPSHAFDLRQAIRLAPTTTSPTAAAAAAAAAQEQATCDPRHVVYDFQIIINDQTGESWMEYFYNHMVPKYSYHNRYKNRYRYLDHHNDNNNNNNNQGTRGLLLQVPLYYFRTIGNLTYTNITRQAKTKTKTKDNTKKNKRKMHSKNTRNQQGNDTTALLNETLSSWDDLFLMNASSTSSDEASLSPVNNETTGMLANTGLASTGFANKTQYDYTATIEVSCYCPSDMPGFVSINQTEWMAQQDTNFCILHRKCEELWHESRVMSVNPFNPRFFFPRSLPFQDSYQLRRRQLKHDANLTSSERRRVCIIGRPQRRNTDFLKVYFKKGKHMKKKDFRFHFITHHMIPQNYDKRKASSFMSQAKRSGFVDFQEEILLCDAMALLLDKKSQPEYFNTSLTGSITQASAYNIPVVIHEELAGLYKDYLPDIVSTHLDHSSSFVAAMDKLLDKLNHVAGKTNAGRRRTKKKGTETVEW